MEDVDLSSVLSKLRHRKGSWRRIARETGLTYWWLSKLARGLIDDPGVKKVGKLARYFRLIEKQEIERAACCANGREAA